MVIAAFEDGDSELGRILVSADGARSSVRRLIAGPNATMIKRLPYAATFVQASYTREQSLFLRSFHPLYIAAPHPRGNFAFFGLHDAPDPEKPEIWVFFFYISWESSIEQQDIEIKTFSTAQRLQQLKELAKDYVEPWKSAAALVPDDQPCFYLGLTIWDPRLPGSSWLNMDGKVTLTGDAAHPMTYQRGQGLIHSITDSGKLLSAIISFFPTNDDQLQGRAIDAYETELKKRGQEEVKLSELNTRLLHKWSSMLESPLFKSGMTGVK